MKGKSHPSQDAPSPDESAATKGVSRRDLFKLGAAGIAAAVVGGTQAGIAASGPSVSVTPAGAAEADLIFVNGKIHTMDANKRIVSQVSIKDGRFVEVGNGVHAQGPGVRVINLKGKTVIPGLIDVHSHIVLVGNRPGHHVLCEDVFTIAGVVERYQARSVDVPPGEWMTTIGPIAARQLAEQRLPNLTELDAVPRPVYIQAAQGGTRTNSLGKALLEAQGVVVAADGTIAGGATGSTLALRLLREQLLTPETRKRTTLGALRYYAALGLTTQLDQGAFQSDLPSGGIANENNYTMHNPFLALNREGKLPARLRINFLHQDSAADFPTLRERLKNTFPFFGDDRVRTGGIGEFTGSGFGVGWQNGTRGVAEAGWRNENHSLSATDFQTEIQRWEVVNQEFPITELRWAISHVPFITAEYVERLKALNGGLVVGWGPVRAGTNVGPPYRTIIDSGIHVGYHADGGDITLINPWLNFYTMITGRNLSGNLILNPAQTVTREEALWLATAANKWFIHEDDLGSIEVGNRADLVVLDSDFFTVPDEDIKRIRSFLTVGGGEVVHDDGVLK